MTTGRWRITLVEDPGEMGGPGPLLPSAQHNVGREPPIEAMGDRGAAALITAIQLLGLRSEGPESFTLSPSNDPIAFLLDAMADAVSLWRGDAVLFRNRAAERLQPTGLSLERRILKFQLGDSSYVLEIISQRS